MAGYVRKATDIWVCGRSSIVASVDCDTMHQPIYLSPLLFCGPARAGLADCGGRPRRRRRLNRRYVFEQRTSGLRIAPAVGKARHLKKPDAAVERHGKNVAKPDGVARSLDAPAVEAYQTADDKPGRVRPRAHHARVPQPFVDALAIQDRALLTLLAGLELFLQGQQLGERRIRVRLLAAPVVRRRPRA